MTNATRTSQRRGLTRGWLPSFLVATTFLFGSASWLGRSAASPPAPEPQPATPQARTKDSQEHRLIGTWHHELGEVQKRNLMLTRLVLRDPPPTPDELAQLSPEERAYVVGLIQAVSATPNAPEVQSMRRVIESMNADGFRVTNGPRLQTVSFGGQLSWLPYRVVSETPESITVEVLHPTRPPEQSTLVFREPDRFVVSGENGEVVAQAHRVDTDHRAMKEAEALLARGEQTYARYCTPCHGTDGAGGEGLAKSFHVDRAVLYKPDQDLINAIRMGTREGRIMPPFGAMVSDEDALATILYMRSAWGFPP